MIEFSDEHEAFRAVVRDFAQRELAPHVERWEAAAELPLEAVAKMAELGVFAIVVPEEWGDRGGDFTSLPTRTRPASQVSRISNWCRALRLVATTMSALSFF